MEKLLGAHSSLTRADENANRPSRRQWCKERHFAKPVFLFSSTNIFAYASTWCDTTHIYHYSVSRKTLQHNDHTC